MAITNTELTTTSPTTIFEAVGQQAITVIYVCNTTATPVSFSMFVIDSADSTGAADSNKVYSSIELTANDTYVISQEKIILNSGDLVELEANIANCITATVSSIAV
jgi:hypothetical protein